MPRETSFCASCHALTIFIWFNASVESPADRINDADENTHGTTRTKLTKDTSSGLWSITYKTIKGRNGVTVERFQTFTEMTSKFIQDFLDNIGRSMWNGEDTPPSLFGFNSVEAIDKMIYDRLLQAGYPENFLSCYSTRAGRLVRLVVTRFQELASQRQVTFQHGYERRELIDESFRYAISEMGWKSSSAACCYLREQVDDLILSAQNIDDPKYDLFKLHPEFTNPKYGYVNNEFPPPLRPNRFANNEGFSREVTNTSIELFDALCFPEEAPGIEYIKTKPVSSLQSKIGTLLFAKRKDDESFKPFRDSVSDLVASAGGKKDSNVHMKARQLIVRSMVSTGHLNASTWSTLQDVPDRLKAFAKRRRKSGQECQKVVRRIPPKRKIETTDLMTYRDMHMGRARHRGDHSVEVNGKLHDVWGVSDDVCRAHEEENNRRYKKRRDTPTGASSISFSFAQAGSALNTSTSASPPLPSLNPTTGDSSTSFSFAQAGSALNASTSVSPPLPSFAQLESILNARTDV